MEGTLVVGVLGCEMESARGAHRHSGLSGRCSQLNGGVNA